MDVVMMREKFLPKMTAAVAGLETQLTAIDGALATNSAELRTKLLEAHAKEQRVTDRLYVEILEEFLQYLTAVNAAT